jgi:hypothetical protein
MDGGRLKAYSPAEEVSGGEERKNAYVAKAIASENRNQIGRACGGPLMTDFWPFGNNITDQRWAGLDRDFSLCIFQ